MHAHFANYAHIMRTFISFVLHTFGININNATIIPSVSHKYVTFICSLETMI